jgi:hypothetical protein
MTENSSRKINVVAKVRITKGHEWNKYTAGFRMLMISAAKNILPLLRTEIQRKKCDNRETDLKDVRRENTC